MIHIANARSLTLPWPPGHVYVGRRARHCGLWLPQSPLANPFMIGRRQARMREGPGNLIRYNTGPISRETSIQLYETWLDDEVAMGNAAITAELDILRGIARTGDLTLVCWCAPRRCHAEVIKEVLEAV